FSHETYAAALESASLKLRGAPADTSDFHRVLSEGRVAYEQVIDAYLDPASNGQLGGKLKDFYRSVFQVTAPPGSPDGLNYDDPANLAAFVAVNRLQVRAIVTADFCVANDLTIYPDA